MVKVVKVLIFIVEKSMEEGKESKNLTARSVLDCVTEFDDWSGKEVFFNNLFLFLSLIIISIRTWDSCNRDNSRRPTRKRCKNK